MNRETGVIKPEQNRVLVAAMKCRNLGLLEAAHEIGVHPSSFRRWLCGQCFPSTETLGEDGVERLLEFAGCAALDEIFPIEELHLQKLVDGGDTKTSKDRMLAFFRSGLVVGMSQVEDAYQGAERALLAQAVAGVINDLSEREAQVLRLRFFEDNSLAECAKILCRSPERVRQIENKALNRIRHPEVKKHLIEFIMCPR